MFPPSFCDSWINSMQLFRESKFILNALVNFWQFRGISRLRQSHCEPQVSQKWEKIKVIQSIIRIEGDRAATGVKGCFTV